MGLILGPRMSFSLSSQSARLWAGNDVCPALLSHSRSGRYRKAELAIAKLEVELLNEKALIVRL